jgi:hypothetical protein
MDITWSVYNSNPTDRDTRIMLRAQVCAAAEESADTMVEMMRAQADAGVLNRTEAVAILKQMVQRYGK